MDYLYKHGVFPWSVSSLATIILLLGSVLALVEGGGNEIDRLSLLEFKARIADPSGVLRSWNDTSHICEWHGIRCGRRHRRVTVLDLSSMSLSRVVSPHIGNLSFLREVNLENNSFHSEIPLEFGRLFRLQKLFLNNNSFSGKIPSNLSQCSNLLALDLGFNGLEGNLPPEFGSLSKLQELVLEANGLMGNIPPSFGNLSSLLLFTVFSNNLGGTIPETLGRLRNLYIIVFDVNKFVGTIPISIFNISTMKMFFATENQLEGSLPSDLGFTLPNLERFTLSFNHLVGPIPKSISNASNLGQFEITSNNFTGKVPSFSKMKGLYRFIIGENNLGGEQSGDLDFLCSLTNSTNLKQLGVSSNAFRGPVPACIGNLSITLSAFELSHNNHIYGTIPPAIGNLINLEILEFGLDNIRGNIPPEIGKLNKIKLLDLSRNKFSGKIPESIGNLSMVIELTLYQNNLQGSIPSSLGNCQNLFILDLSTNNLSGNIPPEIMGLSSLSIYLDLSLNSLTGSLPEVGNLKNLNELRLNGNGLSHQIPSSIGSCASMERLYLEDNFFEGSLPSSMSSMRGLQVLNVSNNQLSGQIPKFLESLNLTYLSLSYNDFQGVLPTRGVFGSSNSTSVVGNEKLCGGLPDFHLLKCDDKEPKLRRLSRTAKVLILSVSTLLGVAGLLSLLYFFRYRHDKKASASSSFENRLLHVSYQTLLKATDGFSSNNLLGVGSFGSVYKGLLSQTQSIVAIKILNLTHHGASRSFIAECEALRRIRHRNLVKVLTACSGFDFNGNDFKALVYEFMSNGSLEEWLHPIASQCTTRRKLSLLERVNIVIDVACALDYLHHHCETPIVHCDLKPNNILLDDEMTGHIGDFGLARFLPEAMHKLLTDQSSSIGVKGSFGYIAPEYGSGSAVSTEGDVYSFGVLILEMFTGKRPTDDMFENGLSLHNFAKTALTGRVETVMDPILLQENHESEQRRTIAMDGFNKSWFSTVKCLASIVEIGVACSSESPRERMNMGDALTKLQGIKKKLLESIIIA